MLLLCGKCKIRIGVGSVHKEFISKLAYCMKKFESHCFKVLVRKIRPVGQI